MSLGRFSRSLSRSPWARNASAAIGGIIALLVLAASLLAASGLSRGQLEERDFGPFDRRLQASAFASFDLTEPSRLGELEGLLGDIGSAGDLAVVVDSFDLRVSAFGRDGAYREVPFAAFPARYTLVDGSWPVSPGDVALTPALSGTGAVVGSRLDILDATSSLHVVGIVEDRWSKHGRIAFGASGTWASLPPDPEQRRGPVSAVVTILWGPGHLDDAIAAAVDAAAADSSSQDNVAPLELMEARRTYVSATVDWSRRLPMAFSVPSLVLPLIGGAAITVLNRHRLRQLRTVFYSNGVAGPRTTGVIAGMVLIVGTLGFVGGLIVGGVLAVVARPALAVFATRPIGPWPSALQVLARPALGLVAGGLMGVLGTATLGGSRQSGHADRTDHGRATLWVRVAVAAILVVSSLGNAGVGSVGPADFTISLGLAAGICCLMPEATRFVAWRLKERSLASALARRRIIADPQPLALQTSVLVMTLVSAMVVAIVIATMVASGERGDVARVPAGHLAVARPDGAPLDRELLGLATGPLSGSSGVVVSELSDSAGAYAEPSVDGGGLLYAFATVNDIQQVVGPLVDDERAMLTSGGVLVLRSFSDTVLDVSYAGRSFRFPARSKVVGPELSGEFAGVLLTETAETKALPISPTSVIFTGTTDADLQTLVERVEHAGFGSRFVAHYEPPQPIVPALGYWAALAATTIVAMGVNLVVARSSLLTVRRYLYSLNAIGVPSHWPRRVVLTEALIPPMVGVPLAVGLAIIPTYLLARTTNGLVFALPLQSILVATALVVAAYLMTAALVVRSIGRPT